VKADSPTSAPSRTVARIPISAPLRMTAPWTMAPCPSVTSSSSVVEYFSCVTWIAQLSWMLERAPTRIEWQSPRRTELYQREPSSPRMTSPMTAAVSARYTRSPMRGLRPPYSLISPICGRNLARRRRASRPRKGPRPQHRGRIHGGVDQRRRLPAGSPAAIDDEVDLPFESGRHFVRIRQRRSAGGIGARGGERTGLLEEAHELRRRRNAHTESPPAEGGRDRIPDRQDDGQRR